MGEGGGGHNALAQMNANTRRKHSTNHRHQVKSVGIFLNNNVTLKSSIKTVHVLFLCGLSSSSRGRNSLGQKKRNDMASVIKRGYYIRRPSFITLNYDAVVTFNGSFYQSPTYFPSSTNAVWNQK